MYKCEKCGKIIEAEERQNKFIVETRDRNYHYYVVSMKRQFKDKIIITEDEELAKIESNKILREFDSKGQEIVKEISICNKCNEGVK